MHRHDIRTVKSELIQSKEELEAYLDAHPGRIVLKKNGLARFARSFESDSREELLQFGTNVLAEDRLIAEPYIEGYNLSVIAFVDGKSYLALPPASDYTKAHDNEEGVLTSGMGAVCPVPIVSGEAYQGILDSVVQPTIEGLKKEGLFYRGVLFISLIVTDDDTLVTSYHVRLGDPEAQVIAPLIRSDFGNLMEAIQNQELDDFSLCLSQDSAVGVVVAGEAYPYKAYEDIPVDIETPVPERDILIFHGATYTKNGSGQVFTNGRRSFTVVGLGDNIVKANSKAYRGIKNIRFDGAWTRSDIGNNFFMP
jgi:phosphoribosylamine--glycine ligase